MYDCTNQQLPRSVLQQGFIYVQIRNGVAAQLSSEEPHSIFIHCFGNSLNLVAGETVKSNKILRELIPHLRFQYLICDRSQAKAEMTPNVPGFRTLCPTR